MPRPVNRALRPFDVFIAERGPEIVATLRAKRRGKGPLPTGLTDEDAAQHAIAELKRRYPRMSDETAAVKFAVTVGGNYIVDEYRAERSRADHAWRAHVVQRAGEPPSAEQAAMSRMRRRRLAEGIRMLPARQRHVIELFYFEGLRRKQIAAVLGLSENAVKGLLQRALASLREHMKQAPAMIALRLRRAAEVSVVAAPRLLAALTLTVLNVPAPMVVVPHAEALRVPVGSEFDMTGPSIVRIQHTEPLRLGSSTSPPPPGVADSPEREDGEKRPTKNVSVGTKLGGEQLGRLGGDEVCVHTGTGQEPFPPCANQNAVGLCPLLRRMGVLKKPYTTCKRHSDPVYEPPPLP